MYRFEFEKFEEVETERGKFRVYTLGDRVLRVVKVEEVAPGVRAGTELAFDEESQTVTLPDGTRARLVREVR